MNQIPSRTVKGWVVVARRRAFLDTIRHTRTEAIAAYNLKWVDSADPDANYRSDRRRYGVQVVRCTITTEATRD